MEEPHFAQECQGYDLGLVSLPDIIGKNHRNGEILDPPCPIAIASLWDQTVTFFYCNEVFLSLTVLQSENNSKNGAIEIYEQVLYH